MINTKGTKETKGAKDVDRAQRIAALTDELENLKHSLPAHSIKPAMLIRIEEMEEEIELLQSQAGYERD